jgi:hypothetical protein
MLKNHSVNQHGGLGKWRWDVSFNANDVESILQKNVETVPG